MTRLALLSLPLALACTPDAPPPAPRAAVDPAQLRAAGPAELLKIGREALGQRRWFQAAEAYRLAQTAGSTVAATYGGLALSYYQLGYMDAAQRQLAHCMQQAQPEPGCLYVAGELMRSSGALIRLKNAEQAYDRLLKLDPNHPIADQARRALAGVRQELIRRQEAGEQLPEGPAANPHAADPHAAVDPHGAADPHGADPGAAKTAQPVGKLNPFGAAIQAGFRAMQAGDAKASEAAYRTALSLHPDDITAQVGLSEALYVLERYDDAAKFVRQAYAQDPKNNRVRFSYGLVMLAAKQPKAAIQAWEAIAKDDPELAKAVELDRRLKEARAAAQK